MIKFSSFKHNIFEVLRAVKIAIYNVSFVIIIYNIAVGIIVEGEVLFELDHNMIRLIVLVHLIGIYAVIMVWFKYISPYHFDTPKAPIYLVFMAWYNTIIAFTFSHGTMWNIDNYTRYDTSSSMFTILCISSFFFIWYWNEIKEKIEYPWREYPPSEDGR